MKHKSKPPGSCKSRQSGDCVGYGKPPSQHQFKPGQSGNKKGRPKGAKNEATILREILTRRLGGRPRKPKPISVMEGIHLRMAEDALKGNTKSATFLLNRYAALVSGELQPAELCDEDRQVLEAFGQRVKESASESAP